MKISGMDYLMLRASADRRPRNSEVLDILPGQQRIEEIRSSPWSVRNKTQKVFVESMTDPEIQDLENLRRGRSILVMVLIVAGLGTGFSASAALLSYSGEHPINTIRYFAVMVLSQIVLLILLAMAAFSGLSNNNLGHSLTILSPARWVKHLWFGRFFKSSRSAVPDTMARLWNQSSGSWLLVSWSQLFAIAFNLGAIAALVWLVSFTDLAFGWSTTLTVTPAQLESITDLVSAPWAWLWPAAVPGTDLIENTRYFRLDGGIINQASALAAGQPSVLGQWWKFLLASLLIYGLAARLLIGIISRAYAGRSLRRQFENSVRWHEVSSLVSEPVITTQADSPDAADPLALAPDANQRLKKIDGDYLCFTWGDFGLNKDQLSEAIKARAGPGLTDLHRLGISTSLDQENELIRNIGGGKVPQKILIVTKSFEPPLLELFDFLTTLVTTTGRPDIFVFMPVNVSGGGISDPDAAGLAVWSDAIRRQRVDAELI